MVQHDARTFVIIGGGAAGAVAAQTLREAGFAGRLVMLDPENRLPYDRTVLSKYVLSGQPGAEKSPLQTQSFCKSRRIERTTGEVVRLDMRARCFVCADGSTFHYDAAQLATGGIPRAPDMPGAGLRGVFALRGRADADAIFARAERSERAMILGASFIGMEVAASLRERGLNVTVVARETVPLARTLGPQIGGALRALHERKGVHFRLGHTVTALHGGGDVHGVSLDDGTGVAADLVVVGYGIRPATTCIDGIPRNDDGTVSVDAQLCVAGGLFAAGDIARFPLRGDGPPIRVEHWWVAQQQGRIAALNMLGRAVRYEAAPKFWTIEYLKRVDYIGHASNWEDVVVHGDLDRPEFLAYFVKNGIVVAAAGMDRDQDTAALLELFDIRRDWTPADLGERPASVLASG